jgi:VanZ family protein
MVAIFIASSQTELPNLPAGLSNYTGHFIAYTALGASAIRAFAGARWSGVHFGAAWRATLLSSAYGVTDELHQTLVPNRFPDMHDWAFDTLGTLLAVIVVLAIARMRRSRDVRRRGV